MESIPALLRRYGLQPRKRLGQHFLADPVALGRIVDAAELVATDCVIEVGAGLGTLTRLLAERAGHVMAVELDAQLVRVLQDEFAEQSNVQIVHEDVLQLPDSLIASGATVRGCANEGSSQLRVAPTYKVVGNLPYNITSAVLRRFLGRKPRPALMVVTVQREVAERIVAGPGQMSLLAVSVQLYGVPHIVARVPAGAFYPPPKVDSAVVRIEVGDQPRVALPRDGSEEAFFRVVRAGFAQKRKMVRNSLSAHLGLPPAVVEKALIQCAIDPKRRAETLSLQEWADLSLVLPGAGAEEDAPVSAAKQVG